MSNKINELTQDIQKRIQEIAYMMWESAGRQQGMATDYWLAAEKEVMATMQSAATAMTRTYNNEPGGEKPATQKAKADTAAKPSAPAKKAAPAKPAARRTTTASRKTKSTS